MFSNFSWSEILVIACVAIIVVGPKDLPGMLRSFGKALGSMKRMANDFQRQFNDALKEAELDDVKDLTSTKGFGPLEDARKSMEEVTQAMNSPVTHDPELEIAPPVETQPEIEAPAVTKTQAKAAPAPAAKAAKPARKPAARKTAAAKTAAAKPAKKPAAARKQPAKAKSAS